MCVWGGYPKYIQSNHYRPIPHSYTSYPQFRPETIERMHGWHQDENQGITRREKKIVMGCFDREKIDQLLDRWING